MKLLNKYYFLIPLFSIFAELSILLNYNFQPTVTPLSDKNNFVQQLVNDLKYINITPTKIDIRQFQSEVEIVLSKEKSNPITVIFSSEINPFSQVTALQKLIEIANIRNRNIKFIDLSTSRPYATL